MGKYDQWTIADCKAELRKRNARLSGKKKALIQRLEDYDRNQNFGQVHDPANTTYSMSLPDGKMYRDVISSTSVPKVTQAAADTFLEPMNATLADGQNLYRATYLKYVRAASQDGLTFVRAECRAEMRKALSYYVDISLSNAGYVQAAQCECAAGQGPDASCKHVCAVICGLMDFTSNGNLFREASCTSQLQTFKKPRAVHQGSPVKGRNLALGSQTPSTKLTFDPRRARYRNDPHYNDHIRNLTLNYMFTPKIPILQSYTPANLPAVDLDHDYLAVRGSEQFLQVSNITTITHEEVQSVEECTRAQSKSQKWKDERVKRVTASNFGRICKAVRADKMKMARSLIVPSDLSRVAAIKYGREKEPAALWKLSQEIMVTVDPVGLCIDPQRPYLAATPDGLLGKDCLVEVKCPYAAKDRSINPTSVPFLEEKDDKLQLKANHDYHYQVQGQMYVTRKSSCKFVVYTNVDFKVIDIAADKEFQQNMVKELDSFYADFFKPVYLDIYFYRQYSKYTFDN